MALCAITLVSSGCGPGGRTVDVDDDGSGSSSTGEEGSTPLPDLGVDEESTGSTDESGESDEEEDEDDGFMSFIPSYDIVCGEPAPDGSGTRCSPCDTWAQDCPEGEKCTAYATSGTQWDNNKCVEIKGDGQPGDDCMVFGDTLGGDDDCGVGSMCWSIDPDTELGYCVGFCQGSPNDPECGEGTVCGIFNNGVLPLCLPTCDPLAAGSDCPDPNQLCVPLDNGDAFVCVLDTEDSGPFATECELLNSCDQGLLCVPGELVPDCFEDNCCTEYCDLDSMEGDGQCSGAGQKCIPYYEDQPPAEYEHVGVCAL